MAPRLPADAAADLDEWLANDLEADLLQLANLFNITYKSVCERRKKLRARMASGYDPRRRAGRKPVITAAVEDFALQLIFKDPTLYGDEVATFIEYEFDIILCQQTISRLWRRASLSRKQVIAQAKQRNTELIRDWKHKMMRWKAEQCVWLDESACNERTGDRRFGMAPVGSAAIVKRWLKKTERLSVLPAYTWKGMYKPLVVKGSINFEIFYNWLEQDILPDLPRYNGLRPVIIMDNVGFHRNPAIRALCLQFDCDCEYLPPYCPFLNPIEEAFHDLKAFVRRHYKVQADGSYANFQPFLARCLEWLSTTEEAQEKAMAHIRHSGYLFIGDQ